MFPARLICAALFVPLASLVAGCAPSAAPSVPAKSKPSPVEDQRADTSQEKLIAAVRSVKRPDDVLGTLPASLRMDVDALLARLSDEQRGEVARLQGPAARAHALLHVAAGGQSIDAFYALATGAAADQLFVARRAAGKQDFTEVIAATRELAERAAARWIHDRVIDVGRQSTYTAQLCDEIDQVALTLGRSDIQLLARQAAAELDGSPLRHLAVAQAAARELEVDTAIAARAAARAVARSGNAEVELQRHMAQAEHANQLIAAARKVLRLRGKTLDLEARLSLARAFLKLQRFGEARQILAPVRAQAKSHLGLATALALALVDGTVCPGLPPGGGNALVCATAWGKSSAAAQATAIVEQAWESGQGRDEKSAEVYLGLACVMPWIYGALLSDQTQPRREEIMDRLQRLQGDAQEATSVSHTFEGLALFVETLAAGFEAAAARKPGERVRLDVTRNHLGWRVRELRERSPQDRFTHAAVLEFAAFRMQETDVLDLVERLPKHMAAQHRLARAVLRMWCAVARQRLAIAEKARTELFDLLPPEQTQALERTRLILMMAEADAAIRRQPDAYHVLEKVASRLTHEDVPLEFRLRASIDQAGAMARTGRSEEAAQLLQRVVTDVSLPAGASTERDLLMVAKSYLFIIRARTSKGEERAEYVQKLADVGDDAGAAGVPASIALWREMWQKEFAYQARVERCGPLKACVAQAKKQRAFTDQEIDERVGAESGLIMRSGVLSAGTVQATFNFSGESGLWPVVSVEPRLLAVELPPRD